MPLGLGPFWDQIATLLLLIAAAIGGVHLYKKTVSRQAATQDQTSSTPRPPSAGESAERILQERYARGQIDRTQYLEMMRNLKTEPGAASLRGMGNTLAEEIVRERYARGEINRSHFQEMRSDLREDLAGVP